MLKGLLYTSSTGLSYTQAYPTLVVRLFICLVVRIESWWEQRAGSSGLGGAFFLVYILSTGMACCR
jgi:hypothetical protein